MTTSHITIAASRIAFHGANKMDAQGYDFAYGNRAGWFRVLKPAGTDTNAPITEVDFEDRDFYVVHFTEEVKSCDCPFCKKEGTCKHIVWLGRKFEEEALATAALIERLEREAEEDKDYDPFGKW